MREPRSTVDSTVNPHSDPRSSTAAIHGDTDWRPGALPPDWTDFGLADQGLDWQEQGLCAQTDPEVFFPERGTSPYVIDAAKRICQACPVREECLAYALANGEGWGVWGGLSEAERRPLVAARHDVSLCARPGCEAPRGLGADERRRKYCSDECMYAVHNAAGLGRQRAARRNAA